MQRAAMLVTMLLVLCLQVFGGYAEEQAVRPSLPPPSPSPPPPHTHTHTLLRSAPRARHTHTPFSLPSTTLSQFKRRSEPPSAAPRGSCASPCPVLCLRSVSCPMA